ncbi:MAG: acetyl-CoA decarbonylase/synthase complex subunit gamma [Candidatus Lokiarchaeota archaeon]|nr:acetyl-CoA decarbonylase/synthase complex subunit gamma [Candidatus Lokiarchaeota archaeon]
MARPSPLDIYTLIDKSNCKECGYDTCMAFASDLLERRINLEDCTHLMKDQKQKKNYLKLKKMITPPQKAVQIGKGSRKIVIGGEEVLMRHQLTFYNQTGIFIEIADNQEDIINIVNYLTNLKIERMGESLTLDGIALRCVSKNGATFKNTAKKIADNTNLPIILCCLDPQILISAADEIKDNKPALYAATINTWEQLGQYSIKNNLPLIVTSNNLDELVSLSASLNNLGVEEIIFDPGTFFGAGNIALNYDNITQLRIAGIEKGNENVGWPIIGVPAAYWSQIGKIKKKQDLWKHKYQEVIMGSIMISNDTSLIILHTGQKKEDIWALLALLTLRQSIFSDPRVYPSVDPGLYKIGDPKQDAPILVTSNYRLTKIPVEIDVKGANIDSWLLVVNSEGIGIESAVAGGQFSASAIGEAVKEFDVFNQVSHRILIIPGMAARLSGALEDEADCYVLVGPRDSSGIKKFIDEKWTPDDYMIEYKTR